MKITIESVSKDSAKVAFENGNKIITEIWYKRNDNTGCFSNETIIEKLEKDDDKAGLSEGDICELYELLDAINIERFINLAEKFQ